MGHLNQHNFSKALKREDRHRWWKRKAVGCMKSVSAEGREEA